MHLVINPIFRRTSMKEIKIHNKDLKNIAVRCRDNLYQSTSKEDALLIVSRFISQEIGEYFGPEILVEPDEISISFIELLDQIIFEMEENIVTDNNIRIYIIDDLYLRLNIFLDIYTDIELYKNNLSYRILTYEDALIIKQHKLLEYRELLISEFSEQPSLQKWILRTIIGLNTADFSDFYFSILQEKVCVEVKILALVGLKLNQSSFNDWNSISTDFEITPGLINSIQSFNLNELDENIISDDENMILFVLNYVELHTHLVNSIEWLIRMFNSILSVHINGNNITNIFISIVNILIHVDLKVLKKIKQNEFTMISFLNFIDFLPREYFDRILVKITNLGNNVLDYARNLVSSGKLNMDESNSNLISYFLESRIDL